MRGLEIQYGVEVRAFSRVERLLGVAVGASRPIGEGPRHRFDRSRESVVLDHLVDEPEFLGRGRFEAFAQEIKAPCLARAETARTEPGPAHVARRRKSVGSGKRASVRLDTGG